jgi:acyl carrier protein
MNEIGERLTKCFAAVFPQLPETQIPLATPGVVDGWDSMASITLLSVIEEEFGIQIEPEDIEYFTSFETVLGYLNNRQVQ